MGLIQAMLIAIVAVLPPLTEGQRAQLDTADDDLGQWDTAALYPLLTNAAGWTQVNPAALLPGAIIADCSAIAARPSQHRGHVFIIEGLFAEARQQPLLRPGPWGETLTRWVLQVGDGPDDIVVIFLTHAPEPPKLGARVRLPARFYKLWPSRRLNDDPISYLLFVGHSAALLDAAVAAPASPSVGGNGAARFGVVIVVLVVAGGLLFMLRRMTRLSLSPRPLPSQLRRRADHDTRPDVDPQPSTEPTEPPLPENPADALAELDRRHDQ